MAIRRCRSTTSAARDSRIPAERRDDLRAKWAEHVVDGAAAGRGVLEPVEDAEPVQPQQPVRRGLARVVQRRGDLLDGQGLVIMQPLEQAHIAVGDEGPCSEHAI
jgi:hypothetical protein